MRKWGILPGLAEKVDAAWRRLRDVARSSALLLVALQAGCDGSALRLPGVEPVTMRQVEFPKPDLSQIRWPGFELPDFSWPEFQRLELPELPVIRLGAAQQWAMPVQSNGILLRVPPPSGMVEYCAGDIEARTSIAERMRNVELLACYAGRWRDGTGLRGVLTALAFGQPLTHSEFQQYKQILKARVRALEGQLQTRQAPGAAAASQVLRILSEGHEWVVHAISRPSPRGGALEAGVVTSVWVRGQLLYLTVTEKPAETGEAAAIRWADLQSMGESWAEDVVLRTLWQRPT